YPHLSRRRLMTGAGALLAGRAAPRTRYINLSAKDVEGVKLGPGGRHGGRDHRMDERRRPQESALVLPNIRGSVDPHGRSQAGRAAANSEARTIEMEGTAQPIADTSTKFMAGK